MRGMMKSYLLFLATASLEWSAILGQETLGETMDTILSSTSEPQGKVPAPVDVIGMEDAELAQLLGKEWLNQEQVLASVGFSNLSNPYPYGNSWYNVNIDSSQKCYAVFADPEKSKYHLISANEQASTSLDMGFGVYLTHHKPCGACSSLQDLHSYLYYRDLKTPIRRCGFHVQNSAKLKCIERVGFTRPCAKIWMWNTVNTKRQTSNGGCFGICIQHLTSKNNMPWGGENPCEPRRSSRESDGGGFNGSLKRISEKKIARSDGAGSSRYIGTSKRKMTITTLTKKLGVSVGLAKKPASKGFCRNKINDGPACAAHQWNYGSPFRLNPCLQCDECRSGPLFQKVAGRTRRNSGIRADIERPGFEPVRHNYFSENVGIIQYSEIPKEEVQRRNTMEMLEKGEELEGDDYVVEASTREETGEPENYPKPGKTWVDSTSRDDL